MLLDIRGLTTSFRQDDQTPPAVNGVSFSIPTGKTVCVVGESGSGKSVTALSILRLIDAPGRIEAGEILFKGQDLLQLPRKAMRRLRGGEIAMIFQEPMTSLNPSYTVGYQLDEALRLHQGHLGRKARYAKVMETLAMVGIPGPEEKYRQYPFKLSGGQRQRVMIAMAMACEPALLIADEPTTALDVTIQAQVLALMKQLQQQKGSSMLFITHDMGVVAQMADEVVVMYKGHVLEKAPAKLLFAEPRHPYTRALLASIPRPGLAQRKTRLATVDEHTDYLRFPREIR